MGHGHHHDHHHHAGSKNLLIAFALNASLSIVELIGGYLTNSVAIYSDALHDLGDALALLFAYFAEKISHKGVTQKYTYGHRRFSVLAALVNGLILFLGSLFVIKEAIERFNSPEAVHPGGMALLAIFGILVNSFAAYRLSKDDGLNQKMVLLHLMEDILGWCAVLIVSVVLLFYPWYILDSILSIMISLFVLRGVYKQFMKISEILLQKFPDNLELENILEKIKTLPNVIDVHGIRGWAIDDSSYTLSLHVRVPGEMKMMDVDEVKVAIKKILHDNNIFYASVEVESQHFDCSEH